MKGDKWNQTVKNKVWITLGLCALTIAITVGALMVYNRSVERYFTDPTDEIVRAESERTTEERKGENADEATESAEASEEPENTDNTENVMESVEPEAPVQAADNVIPSADTGEGMLVESLPETAAEAAGNEVQAAALQFTADSTLLWPVEGSVILDYSPDSTIYFPTLDQYRVNRGIMIQSEVGTPVIAPADARVANIGFDDEIGTYVTLDLGGGYQVTCGQLKDVCVTPEQIVKAGDVIASLNAPTRYFSVEGSHLFVKVEKDGSTLDPLDYIR